MTKEEAIQFLDNIKGEEAGRAIGKDGFYVELLGYHVEALKMAITALVQQPCEDCISRAEAKRIVDFYTEQIDGIFRVNESIDNLPSVQPKAKVGYWIKSSNGMFAECSDCGKHGEYELLKQYKYCPNCGAKMEGTK